MELKITSVAWEEVGQQLTAVAISIEEALRRQLKSDYGADLDFCCVIVSFADDPTENARWAAKHNKVGSYCPWPAGNKRRLLSVAVPISPIELVGLSDEHMRKRLATGIADAVASPAGRLPKGFDHPAFSADVQSILSD